VVKRLLRVQNTLAPLYYYNKHKVHGTGIDPALGPLGFDRY